MVSCQYIEYLYDLSVTKWYDKMPYTQTGCVWFGALWLELFRNPWQKKVTLIIVKILSNVKHFFPLWNLSCIKLKWSVHSCHNWICQFFTAVVSRWTLCEVFKFIIHRLAKWGIYNDGVNSSFRYTGGPISYLLPLLHHCMAFNETFIESCYMFPLCTCYFRLWSKPIWGFHIAQHRLCHLQIWDDPSLICYSSYTM